MSTAIACSGYNPQANQFLFLTRNPDTNDYNINSIISGSTNETSASQALSGINGYPPSSNATFGGLCSYSFSNSSIYLSFEESAEMTGSDSRQYQSTMSSIYQLQINKDGSYQMNKTRLTLYNTTLISFVYIMDSKNQGNFAVISSVNGGTLQPLTATSLSLINIDIPTSLATKPIQGPGVLAVGGNSSQSLYLIQSNSIEEYQLDKLRYSQTNFQQSNIDLSNVIPGMTGQAFYQSSISEYISLYYQKQAEIDILSHDLSQSNYIPISLLSNGLIDINNITSSIPNNTTVVSNSTASSAVTNTASSSVGTTSTKLYTTDISGSYPRTKTFISVPFPTSTDTDLDVNNDFSSRNRRAKRGISDYGNATTMGAYSYRRANITGNDGFSLPGAAMLIANPDSSNALYPYNIVALVGNDTSGYSINTTSGSYNAIASIPKLSGGAIAGIVTGVFAFVALFFGLIVYMRKRSKHYKRNTRSRAMSSIQPDDVAHTFMAENTNISENHSFTSSILQESIHVPDEYHDGSRPDIRPLVYSPGSIDYAQLSNEELFKLEPDVEGTLFLFSGLYTSSADERVTYLKDGYAIRTFNAADGNKHTIHYFSSDNMALFIRSVYAVLHITDAKSSKISDKYVIRSERAIVLSSPTVNFNYQYMWITSSMVPENSLYHLLFERKKWSFVDHHNPDYKIWSVYAILRSIEIVHSHKVVHLAVDLKAFYYDHEMKATDWKLGNFAYAQPWIRNNSNVVLPSPSSFTAPELLAEKYNHLEAADIWSAGCVIYAIATGGKLLFENDIQVKTLCKFNQDMKQHVKAAIRDHIENDIFKQILEQMLCVEPDERKTIVQVLDYWNSLYNMDE